jgi:gliding motility-associated-like protein
MKLRLTFLFLLFSLCQVWANNPPVPQNITSWAVQINSPAVTIAPFRAADPEGDFIFFFIFSTLPSPSQGVLSLNGTPLTAGQKIFNGDEKKIQFKPATGFSGNATFTYSAEDNGGNANPKPATYTIPVTAAGFTAVGLAKEAGTVQLESAGIFEIPFNFTLQNLGTIPLPNVQVTENLLAAFPAPVTVLSVTLTTDNPAVLTLNPAFDGKTNNQLLTGNNALPVGTNFYKIRLRVRVNLNGSGKVNFSNAATATSALTPGGAAVVSDVSNNGVVPDPNTNGDPNESGENAPTPFILSIINSASFCTGNSGVNLVTGGDFGSGSANIAPALPAGTTGFAYKNTCCLNDGEYSIVQDVRPLKGDWTITQDHTGNPGGYYLAVNASSGTTGFFTRKITGLCPGNNYELSLWIRNQLPPGTNLILPRIEFLVDGVVVYSPAPVPENGEWIKQGILFNTQNRTEITFTIRNVPPGGNGNDLGIDDISLVACSPVPVLSQVPVCVGNPAVVVAKLPDFKTKYAIWNNFQWERSTDGGINWTTVAGPFTGDPNAGFTTAPVTLVMNGQRFRLKLATSSQNLASTTCFSLSQTLILQVSPPPVFSVNINPPTCTLNDGTLTVNSLISSDSVRVDGGTFVSGNTQTVFKNLVPGPHTLSLWRFPCRRDTTLNLPVPANCEAVIGLAKAVEAGSPKVQADGSFAVTYLLTVANLGLVTLKEVQITDNLATAFNNPTVKFAVQNDLSATGGLAVNPGFNGSINLNLLAPGNTLAPGTSATVRFTVNVTGSGTFFNTALASGTVNANLATDLSGNGTNPDPNGNGNPKDPGEDDPTPVTLAEKLFIPEGFSPNGDGIHDTFVVGGASGLKILLEVYNRWGNAVYKNADYRNDWDGKCNAGLYTGSEAPDGTYYFTVKLSNGQQFVKSLTINR